MTFYFLKKVRAIHESVVTLALDVVNIAILTLHEAASEIHPKWQGGIFGHPYKNQFRGHFDSNFSNKLDLGTKKPWKIF